MVNSQSKLVGLGSRNRLKKLLSKMFQGPGRPKGPKIPDISIKPYKSATCKLLFYSGGFSCGNNSSDSTILEYVYELESKSKVWVKVTHHHIMEYSSSCLNIPELHLRNNISF